MAGLTLVGIEKRFGQTIVLRGVSLAAAEGEFIALVGPSGCGKSTLLRIAAGLESADAGRVELDGRDVSAIRPADRDVAMVFQSYALYPHLTARQNMAVPLAMRRLSAFERLPVIGRLKRGSGDRRARIRADVEQAAAALRIEALLDRKPGQLSGGQRQRVALGRALVRQPRAFLMDEPLSNLDAGLRAHMRGEIVDLHRQIGVATLYVTHDQVEALGMADRVAVMIGGELLQVATPDVIYREPAHRLVAEFIGSPRINMLPATVDGAGRAMIAGRCVARVKSAAGREVVIGVRPEHLRVLGEVGAGFPARVVRVEFLGSEVLAHLTALCGAGRLELIAKLPPESAPPDVGATVGLVCAAPVILAFGLDGARLKAEPAVAAFDLARHG